MSYVLQKLHMLHEYLKEGQSLSMKEIFDGHDMFVWLPTGQEIIFATKLCLSSWNLIVIVWLLDTIVVSSKHLTSVLG